jgi:hypothetical protein
MMSHSPAGRVAYISEKGIHQVETSFSVGKGVGMPIRWRGLHGSLEDRMSVRINGQGGCAHHAADQLTNRL